MAVVKIGAVIAGLLTQRLHGGPAAASTAIGVMGCVSLAITLALIPGLRRTRPRVAAPPPRTLVSRPEGG